MTARKAQATTGIVLRRANRTGIWTISGPERRDQVFQPSVELRDIAAQTEPPLGPGYWLRSTGEYVQKQGMTVNTAQTWTWVEL